MRWAEGCDLSILDRHVANRVDFILRVDHMAALKQQVV